MQLKQENKIKLGIRGKLKRDLALNLSSLKNYLDDKYILLFADYSNFDIPLFQEFHSISFNDKRIIIFNTTLIFVTQQYNKPFDFIPSGWKTIIVLSYLGALPEEIMQLPEIDEWYDSHVALYLEG